MKPLYNGMLPPSMIRRLADLWPEAQHVVTEYGEAVADAIGVERAGQRVREYAKAGNYRNPDFDPKLTIPTRGAVVEVKAVARLSWSSQIQDLVEIAESKGVVLEIWTDAPIPTRGKLFEAIESKRVIIHELPSR